MVIPRVLHQDRSAEPQILGSALLSFREPVTFSLPPERRHPERSASRISHTREFYGAKSKDPGDACWQMVFGAFRPQTTREIKKVTSSDPDFLSRSTGQSRLCAFLLRKGASGPPTPPTFPGNPGERSRPVPACRGGICSSADLSWRCFRLAARATLPGQAIQSG